MPLEVSSLRQCFIVKRPLVKVEASLQFNPNSLIFLLSLFAAKK